MNRILGTKRFLIARLDRIGDVLLSTPVIKSIRDTYPDSYIAFMVSPYARDVVAGNPYLNEVIVYDKKTSEKGLAGNLKFAGELKKKDFDVAIALHPTVRTHFVIWAAGIPVRVGYDKKWGCLLTERVPHTKQFGLRHETEYSLELLRYAGITPSARELYMPVKAASEEKIEKALASSGISKNDTIIVLNPGASCPSKRWAPERFAKTADELAKKYSAKIVIISDAHDKIFADRTASSMHSAAVNLAGATSVADLASVLKRAKLFVSNDSGPVHIACAVGTPVVAIFGRSDAGLSPRRWAPSGNNCAVLHKYVGCEACLAHNCRIGFKCLDAITAEEVIKAAENILK